MPKVIKSFHEQDKEIRRITTLYEASVVDCSIDPVYVPLCCDTHVTRVDNPEKLDSFEYLFTILKTMNGHLLFTEHYYKKLPTCE